MKTIEQVQYFVKQNLEQQKDKRMPIHNDYESGYVHGRVNAYEKILDFIASEES